MKIRREQIEKQFGKGSVMKMGDKTTMAIESVPTGALALDLALGIGGLPRGRITEIYGPESSGKTTLATHVVAEAQRKVEKHVGIGEAEVVPRVVRPEFLNWQNCRERKQQLVVF